MFSNTALLEHTDRLEKFAYKLTRNIDDAQDLVQSTLVRAIEKKHLFEKDSNLYSWTSKIMYNLFVSAYRRKTKFETQYDPDPYIEKQSIAAEQDVVMEMQDVSSAMEQLSTEHREILVLVCVSGMQYAEVAESLNIPVGTVRSRLSRARESLQNIMDTPRVEAHVIEAHYNRQALRRAA